MVAESTYGRVDFLDPKILLSVLMWVVYLVMVYTRLSAGWRGRRAALLASVAFVAAIVAWMANYFQRHAQVYRFMRFQLIGVNHKTAPVEVRERLAIPESRLAEACKKACRAPRRLPRA